MHGLCLGAARYFSGKCRDVLGETGPDQIFRASSYRERKNSRGKLKLDNPISKYIPEFKDLKVYSDPGTHDDIVRQMTTRDLLRHTSGLTYGYFGNTAVDKMYMANGVLKQKSSLQDMINKLSRIPLLYQPGTKWHYSVSTDVLGYLVQ